MRTASKRRISLQQLRPRNIRSVETKRSDFFDTVDCHSRESELRCRRETIRLRQGFHFAEASAAALCARTVKSADKYDPPSRLRASAFAEPTAATSSCPTLVHILQYVYRSVQSVLPRMERLPAHPLKFHSPTQIAICVRECTVGD